MNTTPEDLIFDESEAIKFILDFIPQEDKQNLTDDDVQYVLDVIDEFYEQNGLYDEETEIANEAFIDEDKMFEFIKKAIKKDHMSISDIQLQLIIEGEFEYGVSIGIYTDED